MSPSRRRQAVLMLRDRLGVSERRACLIAGQHRSTQRRDSCVAADDAALRAALRKLSRERHAGATGVRTPGCSRTAGR